MNKNKVKNLFEFFCLALVLSYFSIHNIFLVIIGISLSIYLINTNRIESSKGYININHHTEDLTKNSKDKDISMDFKSIDIDLINHDTNFKLVEIIEESGFIPSIDKNNDINAA